MNQRTPEKKKAPLALLIVVILVLVVIVNVFRDKPYNEEDVWEEPQRVTQTTEPDLTQILAYYSDLGKVVNSVSIRDAEDVPAEQKLCLDLSARGFSQQPVTYTHSADGTYLGETEIGAPSLDKHPNYETYYTTESGEVWLVFVINDVIMANPLSYNLGEEAQMFVILSEKDTIASYDSESNYFFELLPHAQTAKVITVDRIDAQTLENMTVEVIRSYE